MKSKLGTIFLVSILAIAGLGISYAGLTDTLDIYGTLDAGDVSWHIDDYSGTEVWKVYGSDKPRNEMYVRYWPGDDPINIAYPDSYAEGKVLKVSMAEARAPTVDDPSGYNAILEWNNVFPSVYFETDFTIHYTGTVPGIISAFEAQYDEGSEWVDQYLSYEIIHTGVRNDEPFENNIYLADLPQLQLHLGDELHVTLIIYLPQDNSLKLKHASGHISVEVIQWSEQGGPEPELGYIGNWVWEDTNGNGLQDTGESGLGGVTVNLYDEGNNLIATTTSNSNGYYEFSNLLSGTYVVQFTERSGYQFTLFKAGLDPTKDSDANPNDNGKSDPIFISPGEIETSIDCGQSLVPTEFGAIGDFIWNDLNKNGIQDNGELGLSDVTVNLLDGSENFIATTTSDANGYYSFTNLAPGTYIVQFTEKAGYQFTTFMAGADPTKDSDANPSDNGESNSIAIASGQTDNTIDCGQYEIVLDVDIGIVKTVNNSNPIIGQKIKYTITATNYGPATATNVIVNDLLPGGLIYVSHVASSGTYVSSTGDWAIPSIGNGNSVTLDITATVQGTTTQDYVQLAMVLDGSGSISGSDWTTMKQGLNASIRSVIPHNGHVELTVVQFAQTSATLEVGPVVLTDSNYITVSNQVQNIGKRDGTTPLACGLNLVADTLRNSPFYNSDYRQVINIVTDGNPNVNAVPGPYTGTSCPVSSAKSAAVTARNYLISHLQMTNTNPPSFNKDEIDSEAVGTSANIDLSWLNNSIIWPQPGTQNWPPSKPGWLRQFATYTDFAQLIHEKFQLIFGPVINYAHLTQSTPADSNSANNEGSVSITPQP